jgi:hypothetical protein
MYSNVLVVERWVFLHFSTLLNFDTKRLSKFTPRLSNAEYPLSNQRNGGTVTLP